MNENISVNLNLVLDPAQIEEENFVIEETKSLPRCGPKGLRDAFYGLKVGQCFVCKPGLPLRPHQTTYHYNKHAENGFAWRCSCTNGIYRIHRVK